MMFRAIKMKLIPQKMKCKKFDFIGRFLKKRILYKRKKKIFSLKKEN